MFNLLYENIFIIKLKKIWYLWVILELVMDLIGDKMKCNVE